MKTLRKNYKYIIAGIALLTFVLILEDVFEVPMLSMDKYMYALLVIELRNNTLTAIMKMITFMGSAYFLGAFIIISFIFIKNKKIPLCFLINLVTITLLNQTLKIIIKRPRPIGYRLINETGYSFPSGHAMVTAAFYGYLIYIIYKYIDNKVLKYVLMVLCAFLILLIGLSRIYLGVHYASDVVGGITFSIFYLILFVNISKKYISYK